MSGTVEVGAGPDRPMPADRRGRGLLWGAAGLGIVVLALLVGALTTPRTTTGDLEPTSAAPAGARAVAQILGREGVDVRTVTLSTQVADRASADTTTLVTFPDLLGPEQLDRLARAPGTLVLVAPDFIALQRLAPFARAAGTRPAFTVEPGCADPTARAAGRARAGDRLYALTPAADRSTDELCYLDGTAAGEVRGSLVVGAADGRRVVVLGQPDVLRNSALASPDGTAALALRLLGQHPTLLWYLPDPNELAVTEDAPTLGDVLPSWVWWVGAQLLVASLVAMVWRGRRLGRLVGEPLPVVVRAAETQEGRARLYRRAKAYDRTAGTLRTAALRRLSRRLDVSPDASPDVLVALVAQTAHLEHAAVARTFLGPPPSDDRGLVRLADEITAVETAVASVDATGRQPGAR